MTETAESTVFIDNERTRVTQWHFAPGAATGWHRHEHDYVVIPLRNGRVKQITGGGAESVADHKAGQPYFRATGVEHNVINDGESEYAFIEVEFK